MNLHVRLKSNRIAGASRWSGTACYSADIRAALKSLRHKIVSSGWTAGTLISRSSAEIKQSAETPAKLNFSNNERRVIRALIRKVFLNINIKRSASALAHNFANRNQRKTGFGRLGSAASAVLSMQFAKAHGTQSSVNFRR